MGAAEAWPALELGGAGLAGLATPLAPRLPCPVLDNLAEALQATVPLALGPGAPASPRSNEPGPWKDLSPALTQWLDSS